jgi:hypothetical protein
MKKLLTIGLLLMSSIASAAYFTYTVGAGQVVSAHAPFYDNRTLISIDAPVAGVYDLTVLGVTHNGNPKSPSPSLRRDFHTIVGVGTTLTDPNGLDIPLTIETLPTIPGMSGYGSRVSATKISLVPGIYTLELATSCNNWCSYFQNFYSVQVSLSK